MKSHKQLGSFHGCTNFLVRKKVAIIQETPFSNFSGFENHIFFFFCTRIRLQSFIYLYEKKKSVLKYVWGLGKTQDFSYSVLVFLKLPERTKEENDQFIFIPKYIAV